MAEKQMLKLLMDFEASFWEAKNIDESLDMYKQLFDQSLLTHSPLGTTNGHLSVQNAYVKWLQAFPNIKIINKKYTSNNNLVFWEWMCEAKHEGDFQGMKPSGKDLCFSGKTIYLTNQDKITDYTCYIDMHSIYQKLGYSLQKQGETQPHSICDYYSLVTTLKNLIVVNDAQLTARELEILSYWLFGYSSKLIGKDFNISPRTVESHIDKIKDKLSCCYKNDLQSLIHSKNAMYLFYNLYIVISKK